MSKKCVLILIIAMLCVLVFSCRSKDDHFFFKGEIVQIKMTSRSDTLEGDLVKFDDEVLGLISVYDSLIFFYNPMNRKFQYCCYNYETGKHVANFFPVGRGRGEFLNVTPMYCMFNCGDTIKSIFVAANEQKIGIFNVTQSIFQDKSVLESISDFEWKKRFIKPITQVYPLDNRIIGYIKGREPYFKKDNYTLPQYILFDKATFEIVDTIELYNKIIIKKLIEGVDMNIFGFFSALKPDGTRMASVMGYLPQINIWDIKTGKIKGIRFGQTTLWNLIDNPQQAKMCHVFMDIDDKYIYAPWFVDGNIDKGTHIINVFSWEGNHIAQYYIEEPFDQIQIEPKSNTLFTFNQFTNKLYRYKLPDK